MTESPIGPAGLGITLDGDATVADGWLVRRMRLPAGLDGPRGYLQGGLCAGVLIGIARAADPHGAPATAVDARLHAPTPLGSSLTTRVRRSAAVATFEVELATADKLLVSGSVELAGHDVAAHVHDLAELSRTAPPPTQPLAEFPDCWVCGAGNTHPMAQHIYPGLAGDEIAVTAWLADEALASAAGSLDDVVAAAVLDCPTTWVCMATVRAQGRAAAVLGGLRIRFVRPAPVEEVLRLVARLDRAEGRKLSARSALVDSEGVVYATASALQVAVDQLPEPR